MFAYCNNNPILMNDPNGCDPRIIVIGCIVVIVALAYGVVTDSINNSGANEAEKELIYEDPIAAYNVNKAKEITEEYIDKLYGREHDRDGTQVNAFRHAMWNAIMTDMIGAEKAKKFADAHEQVPNNPAGHKQMDLHNNELGRSIATQYAGQGYDVFAEKIIEAINNGDAEVLIWDPNVK
jgi:hypothetical protein